MENEQPIYEAKMIDFYNKTRSWVTTFLGVIVTVVAVAIIFIVSSLEGTKEIKASGSDSAKMLTQWREENSDKLYPEEKAEIIEYDNKEYYFIVESVDAETGDIEKWYFAYDGGIGYIFSDYKFYVLTGLTIFVSIIVSDINYSSTVRSVVAGAEFKRTLVHYQEKKEKIAKSSQYLPDYCNYKNKQAYEDAVRDIVEDSGLNFNEYKKGLIDVKKLEKWQQKKLLKIRKIKIRKMHTSDLLQEHGGTFSHVKTLLPQSMKEHKQRFLIKGIVQKIFSSALSGLTVGFGVIFGNWVLGLTYGLVILTSFVVAIFIATDYATNTLRNRFITKADFLVEFDNIKEKFIEKEPIKEYNEEKGANDNGD